MTTVIEIIAPKKNLTIVAPERKGISVNVLHLDNLVDESGNLLVDESGAELIAQRIASEKSLEIIAPKKNLTIIAPEVPR